MAKKFSVSIPDTLAERLEPFQDKINPTAVFQNALLSIIEKSEQRKKRMEGENMNAIIERLRSQKAESEKGVYDAGVDEGYDFAKTYDYDDLKYAATILAKDRNPAGIVFRTDCKLFNYFGSLEDDEGNDLFDSLTEDETETWLKGWCDAVGDFWNNIQSKL